jgi:hypothetical protein
MENETQSTYKREQYVLTKDKPDIQQQLESMAYDIMVLKAENKMLRRTLLEIGKK